MDLAQKTSSMGSLEKLLEKFSAVGGLFLIFSGRKKFQRRRRKKFSFVIGEARISTFSDPVFLREKILKTN